MKTKFQCPPAFDVNAARVYLISPQFKDDFAGKPHISVMELNGKQKPAYLSAMGKVWTEIPLPSEVLFEEVVHDCNGGGNYVKHFHTQFEIAKHIVHVDYVLAWSYGPGHSSNSCDDLCRRKPRDICNSGRRILWSKLAKTVAGNTDR